MLARLADEAPGIGDPHAALYPHLNRGIAAVAIGRLDLARMILLDCVHVARELGDSTTLAESGTATATLLALEGDERAALRLYRRSSEQLGTRSAFYSLMPFRRDVLEPLDERFRNGNGNAVDVPLLGGDSLASEIIAALGPDERLETRSLRRS